MEREDMKEVEQKEQKPIFKKGDKVIWDDEEFNILDVNETEYNVGGYRVPFSRQNELHPIWQKPAEWSDDYNEENLQIRFAFYTYKDDPSVIYLSNVFVEETSRNHGLGTRILKAAEKAAEAIGAITIRLKVKRDNPANAWYRKHGYNYLTSEGDYDWLEKNLEYMKPNKQEWSEEDEAKLGALINYFDGDALDYSTDDIVNWLKSLRPQSKQKQNDYITPHKEFFKFIYDRLINVHKENPNVDYMRSFKERLNNLSFGEKQEWSEEDEEMLNSCISSIEESKENRYAYKETDGDTSYDREIDWLKSLRNRVGKEFLQPHWKPSEEQMEALKDAFRKDGCNEYRKVINSLYCDLQKLL